MTLPSDLPSPSNAPVQPPLGAQTFRGSWISVGGQGAQLVVRLASTVVLARLLTPDAYGLTAMVTVVTGFVGLFKSLGLATATIQAPRLSERELSGLYWINALIGVVAMLLTLVLAPAMSWFYAEPRVAPLMAGLSVTFLFGGFAVQPAALLRRRLQFASIAAIELAAVAVGAVTAVLLARAGAGPWALVAGVVSTELSNLVLVSVVVDWKPMRPSFNTSLGHLLGLGRDLTMFNVLNYWARNLDNFLIGRFWGAAELGLYGRAYQLLLLPLQQVTTPLAPVAIAALSRLQQDGPRFRSAYVRILEKVSIVCMPLTTFLFFNAREVVALVLGTKWLEVAPIFAALAAAAIVQPISATFIWLLVSQGRRQELRQWSVVGSVLSALAIVAGLKGGAVGVAATYAACEVFIRFPLLTWLIGRRGAVRAPHVFRALGPGMAMSASIAGVGLILPHFAKATGATGLAESVATSFMAAALTLAAMPSGRRAFNDVLQAVRAGSRPRANHAEAVLL